MKRVCPGSSSVHSPPSCTSSDGIGELQRRCLAKEVTITLTASGLWVERTLTGVSGLDVSCPTE